MIAALLIGLIIIVFLIYRRKRDPEKIFGIYAQPGKWFYPKYVTFLTILLIRRLKAKLEKPVSDVSLESVKSLSSHPKAFDAVFFHAVSHNGLYFCGGIERRHHAKVNGLFYLVVPELGLLESMKLPKTQLDADPTAVLSFKAYAADGLSFAPIKAMKTWHLSYKGPMKLHDNPEKTFNVNLDSSWTTDSPYFFFETHVNPKTLAKAIARETWTRKYFKDLKEAHQSHYEQMGDLTGTLTIDQRSYKLKMDAFRDHSFGHKRDWSLMHRYVFHMFYLEDGTRVSVGVVSQPCTTSHLEMGYVLLPDKVIRPIENCDFVLYQHGENGTPGQNYAFTFNASGQTYEVEVDVKFEATHYKGDDVEAKLIERFVDCRVNGVKGRGISEWHYNNL